MINVNYLRPVRSAYQPPASSISLSEQTSQQYFSLTTNQHQPSATSQTKRAKERRRTPAD
jgi:hypothetical protein